MPDFTLDTYYRLLNILKEQHFTFQTFSRFLREPTKRFIILRHDVDARKMNSFNTARMEKELGITGTYYFRMVPQSFDEEVIKQISGLGHEIGYHYEDVSTSAALLRMSCVVNRLKRHKTQDSRLTEEELLGDAIASFRENLSKLRRVVPIETICMHGSPLSRYDNRILWEKYNYTDYGIIGEPYFDINFEEVLYLTDTGRRWDGDSVSIRDKVRYSEPAKVTEEAVEKGRGGEKEKDRDEILNKADRKPHVTYPMTGLRFHSTFDIIRSAESGSLPDKIMITIHPQRWTNKPLPWIQELVWQNLKNLGKRVMLVH